MPIPDTCFRTHRLEELRGRCAGIWEEQPRQREEPVQRPWGRRTNVAQDSAEEEEIRTENWRWIWVGEVGAGLVWI